MSIDEFLIKFNDAIREYEGHALGEIRVIVAGQPDLDITDIFLDGNGHIYIDTTVGA